MEQAATRLLVRDQVESLLENVSPLSLPPYSVRQNKPNCVAIIPKPTTCLVFIPISGKHVSGLSL
jgi:hypothetical protein